MNKNNIYIKDAFFNIFMINEYIEKGSILLDDIDINNISDIEKSEIIEFLLIINDFIPSIISIEDELGNLKVLTSNKELLVIVEFLNGKFSLTGLKHLHYLNGEFFSFSKFRELKRISLEFLIIDKFKSDPLVLDYAINRLIKK